MNVDEFENLSLVIGIGALILYMLFIIYKLGVESKANRFGKIMLFIGLGLGFTGFIAKSIIVELMKI
jgi:K+ transporter